MSELKELIQKLRDHIQDTGLDPEVVDPFGDSDPWRIMEGLYEF